MSYHHIRGTIKYRVTNRMRLHLKYYSKTSKYKFSNKPDKIFIQYCKVFNITYEQQNKFITDKCVEWFFDKTSDFYHAGSLGNGLDKLLKYNADIINNNQKQESKEEVKPKRTYITYSKINYYIS